MHDKKDHSEAPVLPIGRSAEHSDEEVFAMCDTLRNEDGVKPDRINGYKLKKAFDGVGDSKRYMRLADQWRKDNRLIEAKIQATPEGPQVNRVELANPMAPLIEQLDGLKESVVNTGSKIAASQQQQVEQLQVEHGESLQGVLDESKELDNDASDTIQSLERVIFQLRADLSVKDDSIDQLKTALESTIDLLEKEQEKTRLLNEQITPLQNSLKNLGIIEADLKNANAARYDLKEKILKEEETVKELRDEIKYRLTLADSLNEKILDMNDAHTKQVENAFKMLGEKDGEIKNLQARLQNEIDAHSVKEIPQKPIKARKQPEPHRTQQPADRHN